MARTRDDRRSKVAGAFDMPRPSPADARTSPTRPSRRLAGSAGRQSELRELPLSGFRWTDATGTTVELDEPHAIQAEAAELTMRVDRLFREVDLLTGEAKA